MAPCEDCEAEKGRSRKANAIASLHLSAKLLAERKLADAFKEGVRTAIQWVRTMPSMSEATTLATVARYLESRLRSSERPTIPPPPDSEGTP